MPLDDESPIRNDPEWRRFAKNVRRDLIPKMRDSAIVMSLVPGGEPDVKYALELGMSIMLDKPIIAVFSPGTKLPEHLVRVADELVEADLDTDEGRQLAVTRLQEAMARLDLDKDRQKPR